MIPSTSTHCPYCSAPVGHNGYHNNRAYSETEAKRRAFEYNELFADSPEGKNRGLAVIFAFFFGTLGIHYFYMGKTTAGIICLLITLCSCGFVTAILSIFQSIKMLIINNVEWRKHYILSQSTFPV